MKTHRTSTRPTSSETRRTVARPCGAALAIGAFLLLATPAARAQGGDLPPSVLEPGLLPLSMVDLRDMPAVDVAAAQAFDASVTDKLYAPIGSIHKAGFDTTRDGTWETLSVGGPAGGGEVWRLRVRSGGALWVRAAFGTWRIPDGAKMWTYDPGMTRIEGPYTSAHVQEHGQRWTPPIQGDEAVFELYWPPAQQAVVPNIHMTRFSHGYADTIQNPPEFCHITCDPDVTCPIGADISAINRGVVRIYVPIDICPPCDGSVEDCFGPCIANGDCLLMREAMCTGSLVNTTANDCRQLVVTAGHCMNNAGLVPGTRFLFNYESSDCCVDDAVVQDEITGATYLMEWEGLPDGASPENTCLVGPIPNGSDVALIEIDDEIPASFNARFNGWTRGNGGTSAGIGIHQYSGASSKKVAASTDGFQTHATDSKFWTVPDWELGKTKGGSSGSPLFNAALRITGVLSTGPDPGPCTGSGDNYGKLSAAWDPLPVENKRLRNWLDPAATNALSHYGKEDQPGNLCAVPPWGQVLEFDFGTQSFARGSESLLPVTLGNPGQDPLTDVMGVLTTTTPGVTITQAQVEWSDIPGGGQARGNSAFRVRIHPNVPCGAELEFTLTILSSAGDGQWSPSFTLRHGRRSRTVEALAGYTQTSLEGTHAWSLDSTDDTPLGQRWFIGNIAARSDTTLETPPVTSLPPDARLKFRTRFDTENTFDGGVLEYTTGTTAWVDANDLIVRGGYLSGLSSAVAPDVRGRNAWSGDSDGWRKVELDLASLAGETVRFRWRFVSDSSEGDVGWWIDDAVIECSTYECVPERVPGFFAR